MFNAIHIFGTHWIFHSMLITGYNISATESNLFTLFNCAYTWNPHFVHLL